jgi:hypothetical protein
MIFVEQYSELFAIAKKREEEERKTMLRYLFMAASMPVIRKSADIHQPIAARM